MVDHSQLTEPVKHAVDVVSAATALGAITTLLPPIAALLTIFWTFVRIYDRFISNKKKPTTTSQD
jgi:glycerol-3-phosphate acyltransferase PlsY